MKFPRSLWRVVNPCEVHAEPEALESWHVQFSRGVTMMWTHQLNKPTSFTMNLSIICCATSRCRDVGRKTPPRCLFFSALRPQATMPRQKERQHVEQGYNSGLQPPGVPVCTGTVNTGQQLAASLITGTARVIEKTCFLTVSSQGKQRCTTLSSLTPAHKKSPKTPAVALYGHVLCLYCLVAACSIADRDKSSPKDDSSNNFEIHFDIYVHFTHYEYWNKKKITHVFCPIFWNICFCLHDTDSQICKLWKANTILLHVYCTYYK